MEVIRSGVKKNPISHLFIDKGSFFTNLNAVQTFILAEVPKYFFPAAIFYSFWFGRGKNNIRASFFSPRGELLSLLNNLSNAPHTVSFKWSIYSGDFYWSLLVARKWSHKSLLWGGGGMIFKFGCSLELLHTVLNNTSSNFAKGRNAWESFWCLPRVKDICSDKSSVQQPSGLMYRDCFTRVTVGIGWRIGISANSKIQEFSSVHTLLLVIVHLSTFGLSGPLLHTGNHCNLWR